LQILFAAAQDGGSAPLCPRDVEPRAFEKNAKPSRGGGSASAPTARGNGDPVEAKLAMGAAMPSIDARLRAMPSLCLSSIAPRRVPGSDGGKMPRTSRENFEMRFIYA